MSEKPREKLPLKWIDEAKEEWEQILAFFARRNGSVTYSLKLDAELQQILERLRDNPHMGQRMRKKNVRRVTFQNYALFFRVKSNCLEVVAVVDARRNVPLD